MSDLLKVLLVALIIVVASLLVWRLSAAGASTSTPAQVWQVQLHRINDDGVVLSSWTPIVCKTGAEAHRTAHELSMSNQWGSPGNWPTVRITQVDL